MTKEKTQESKNIYQRINTVCKEVSYVQKKDKAPKGLPYRFVSHDQVMGVLHKPMADNGIVLETSMEEFSQEGNKTTVGMTVSFVNVDNPTDRVTVKYWSSSIDPSDKGPGKCISYIIKYVLLKTFCLETGEDADASQHEYKSALITDEQLLDLELTINGHEKIKKTLMNRFNGDPKGMTQEQYKLAIKWVKKELGDEQE